jgi:hypothetical protein
MKGTIIKNPKLMNVIDGDTIKIMLVPDFITANSCRQNLKRKHWAKRSGVQQSMPGREWRTDLRRVPIP